MNSPNSVKVFLAFLTLSAINSSIFAAQTQMSSQVKAPSPTPFPVCIDDSDCVKLGKGDKFACFQVRKLGLKEAKNSPKSLSTQLKRPTKKIFIQSHEMVFLSTPRKNMKFHTTKNFILRSTPRKTLNSNVFPSTSRNLFIFHFLRIKSHL